MAPATPDPGHAPPPAPAADGEFGSPVSAAKVDRILRLLGLSSASYLFDAGCGDGELLVRAAEQVGAAGVGVDTTAEAVASAAAKAARRAPAARLSFVRADVAAYAPDRPVDVAFCLGASHAFGGYRPALRALGGVARDGGHVVVGDLFWEQEPAPEYLAVLGETRDVRLDHAGNVAAGLAEGLLPLYAAVSSTEEWDDFEGRSWCRKLRAAAGRADRDERVRAVLRWQEAYLRWGRWTLGFGLYLFQKTPPPPGG